MAPLRVSWNRRRIVFLTAPVVVGVCLIALLYAHVSDLRIARQESENASTRPLKAYYSKLAAAKVLVRGTTGAMGAGRLRGSPEYVVSGTYSERQSVGYPFEVCEEGAPGESLFIEDCRWYVKTDAGASQVKERSPAEIANLRWLVLETHGVIERLQYGPASMVEKGMTGVHMGQSRGFTDAWLVDLKMMEIVAHQRFEDDPLPSVIQGDYFSGQRQRIADGIKAWMEKKTR